MSVPTETIELYTYSPIHLDVLGPEPPEEDALETTGQVILLSNSETKIYKLCAISILHHSVCVTKYIQLG